MQKKLIALAIAGLASSAAFAQSNVQIYGIADVGLISLSTSNEGANAIKSHRGVDSGMLSGSRIGFKGTEDLGNGLKAIFTLEYALNLDDTAGIGDARQEFLGLTGGFGTAVAGRLQTPAYDHVVKYNALSGTAVSPQDQVTRRTYGAGISHADRVDNAIAYISPNLSGVTLKAAYSFVGENKDVEGDGRRGAYVLSADYENGPIAVGAVYRRLGDLSNNGDNSGNKEWGLGGSYDFGVAKLFATYQQMKEDDNTGDKARAYQLGVVAPVTAAGAVHFAYATSKVKANDGGDAVNGAKAWTLAYTHGLSKRTTAYAGYTYAKNKDYNNGGESSFYGLGTDSIESGKRAHGLFAGLRHSF